ncbi:MAG: RNA polymerase sigma factor [Eggerthellaceae bacterium]
MLQSERKTAAEQRRHGHLFNRHAATVYRLCYSFLGSAADAEDATQSVFMKLIARPRRFNDAEHEKAWLIVCARTIAATC